MKRVALLTVFFYVCTFASPQRVHAIAPVALIGAAAIGTAMLSASIGSYYAQNGVMPQYVTSTANAIASAADAVFQPSYLAQGVYSLFSPQSINTAKDFYIGKAAALGASIGNILDYVNSVAGYDALKSLVTAHTNPSPGVITSNNLWDPTGTIFSKNGQNYKVGSGIWNKIYGGSVPAFKTQYFSNGYVTSTSGSNKMYAAISPAFSYPCLVCLLTPGPDWLPSQIDVYGDGYIWGGTLTPTNDAVTYPPSPPSVDYPGLASALANPSNAVADDLRNAIKNMPPAQVVKSADVPAAADKAQSPPALTAADIAQALKDNSASVAKAVAEAASAIAAANPNDPAAQIAAQQAAAEAAKAAADAAQSEPAEETFSPISDTAFTEPYNPGEFDIPARFTQFLNNVKSSGLFSFSNDFFNSLPGGGSSVYEIEAGQYGHHTIDLSDTLSTGLAVLKTILLVCFGFLSIRAVIMKR